MPQSEHTAEVTAEQTVEFDTAHVAASYSANKDSEHTHSSNTSAYSHDSSSETQDDRAAAFFDGSYDFESAINDKESGLSAAKLSHQRFPGWSIFYNAVLAVLDTVMTLLATFLVFLFRPSTYQYMLVRNSEDGAIGKYLVLIVAAWLISLVSQHAYARHTMGEGYELYSKIVAAMFMDFIFLCTFVYLIKLEIPRSLTIAIPLITGVLTIIERWVMRRMLHHNRNKGEYNYKTVVVGSPEGIHATVQQLTENKGLGYLPVAICPVESVTASNNDLSTRNLVPATFVPQNDIEKHLHKLSFSSHLPQNARIWGAQTILVADVMMSHSEAMKALSLAAESMGLELAFSASVADMSGATVHMRNDPTMPVLTARLTQYSLFTKFCKRVIDIVGSIVALILFAIPMMIVAVRIKREDGGPVFYHQQRVGIYGKTFTMHKFRSMRVDADDMKDQLAKENGLEDNFIFKMKNDPRITKIGNFMRPRSIDELPQLFNVLKGDMSLVGPRPALPDEVAKYEALYSSRLLVKPGITGVWQISGRSNLTQEQSEFADVSYIQNWSLTGDIAIIMKTFSAVIHKIGAY